jgi:hypothetical protein
MPLFSNSDWGNTTSPLVSVFCPEELFSIGIRCPWFGKKLTRWFTFCSVSIFIIEGEVLEKLRFQFDLTPKMALLLDRLVAETGASTRAEVLRRAISIFGLLCDESSSGKRIEVADPKTGIRERLIVQP